MRSIRCEWGTTGWNVVAQFRMVTADVQCNAVCQPLESEAVALISDIHQETKPNLYIIYIVVYFVQWLEWGAHEQNQWDNEITGMEEKLCIVAFYAGK